MPANTTPIWVLTPNLSATGSGSTTLSQPITLAANDFTGAGANNSLIFTAGASSTLIDKIRFKAIGTNVQTVARMFLNNGLTNLTAANNLFIDEVQLPASTASANSITAPAIDYVFSGRGLFVPPNFRIYVGLGTAVSACWVPFAIAADY